MNLVGKVLILAFFALSFGCKGTNKSDTSTNDTDQGLTFNETPYSTQETALSMIESASENAAGTNSSPMLQKAAKHLMHQAFQLKQPLTTDCSKVTSSPCTANTFSINWNSCTLSNDEGEVVTVVGAINLTFTVTSGGQPDNATCAAEQKNPSPLPNGDTIGITENMTVIATNLPGTPQFNNMQVIMDTNPPPTYDGTTFGLASLGTTVATSGIMHTLSINGAHQTIVSPSGKKWLDHTVFGQVTQSGTLQGGDLTVQSGSTVTVWHNLLKYRGAYTFQNDHNNLPLAWTDPTCCHPTQGKMVGVYSGDANGTATLEFTSACGTAIYTRSLGTAQSVNLEACN